MESSKDKQSTTKDKVAFTILPVFLFALLGVFAYSIIPNSASTGDGFNYEGNVCTSITRADGSYESLGCSHNLVTTEGLNAIKDILGQGGVASAFATIGLCNASLACGPAAAGSTGPTFESEYLLGGLARQTGTYDSLGTGNWSIYKQFTSTVDGLITNKTGLFNSTTVADSVLLAENTFSLATLNTNDQLTVNWTIAVTNAA